MTLDLRGSVKSERHGLEIGAAALQFVEQIALNLHVIRSDDVRIGGYLLDLAFTRVRNAGEEVDQAARHILVRRFEIDDNRALFFQVVSDLRCVLKALGLDEYDLELSGA